jgi:ubiquinone/menaquinone biosynthesis C-methylase UbiE
MPDYVAITYDEKRTPKTDYPLQMAKYLANRFNLKSGATFLEIACGRGDFLRAFNCIGMQCTAVDISQSAIDLNKDFGAKLCNVSCEELPFSDNSFDIVYSKSLVEHMWDATFLMSEIRRVLKPGGLCITMTPDWVSQMPVFFEDYTHCRPYTLDSLRDLMISSKFLTVKSEFFCQHPLIWNSKIHAFLAKIIRMLISTPKARKITEKTGIKFFRWSVELMILATGYKHE